VQIAAMSGLLSLVPDLEVQAPGKRPGGAVS